MSIRIFSALSLVFIIFLFAILTLAPVETVFAAPVCPLSSASGRVIITFDGSRIVSDAGGLRETSASLTPSLAAGRYDITLVSYDDHLVETASQDMEQWFAIMKNANGGIISMSKPIDDLPDGQTYITQTVDFNHSSVRTPVTAVVARHAAVVTQGNNQNSSIVPVCVAFDLKDGLPQVTTDIASSVDSNEATLYGYVVPNGISDTVAWFEWGTSSALGLKTNENRLVYQRISERMTGLAKNTQYYFRAAARNGAGTSYGPILTFTTAGADLYAPFVRTDAMTNMGETSATFNGYVNPHGSSNTVRWFEWGYSPYLGYKTSEIAIGSAAVSMSEYVTSLTRSTSYYVRAFARNQKGTSQGELVSFQTYPVSPTPTSSSYPTPSPSPSPFPSSSPSPVSSPTVSTQLPTFVSQNTAVLNGHVTAILSVGTNVWFEWGTQSSLGSATSRRNIGYISSADFADSLIGLSPNSFYYFRAVAENAYGKSYGTVFLFRTAVVSAEPPKNPPPSSFPLPFPSLSPAPSPSLPPPSSSYLGLIDLIISPSDEIVPVGTIIPFAVTFKNIANTSLDNAVLNVTLPPDLVYQNVSKFSGVIKKNGALDSEMRVITFSIGTLAIGDKGFVTIETLLKQDTVDRKIFTTKAEITFIDPATRAGGKETAFAINTARKGTSFAALAFVGACPSWLLFGLLGLLMFILLFLLWRQHKKEEEKDNL